MTIPELYSYFLENYKVSTDTRKIIPQSIFFALKGANFDGNQFAEQALKSGAAHAVIDNPKYQKDERFFLVENVLKTLQDLARYHRARLNIPIIGVTGTNGKTTTKELLYAVLKRKFNVYATKGNLNNHIGVPLSILDITPDIEIAIIEMGANHIKEIEFLCEIAQPAYGMITNVGKAHLEGFGSFEGVKAAKGELYDWLEKTQGTLILQADNANLVSMANTRKFKSVITYGFSDAHDVTGKLVSGSPKLVMSWSEKNDERAHLVETNLTGAYNMENILGTIATALCFELTPKLINTGLAAYVPTNKRSQIIKTANNTVICDYYNANASSMSAALENLKSLDAKKKSIVLGDMFELGKEASSEHKKIIEQAIAMELDKRIFVGTEFYRHHSSYIGDAIFYNTIEEAIDALQKEPVNQSFILLKASRGMAFEKLLIYL
ncbi:UDP-N-acetylmuramoyl-tripeptide--D-alanyl-D-alanine ligase [Olivibacter sp. SDN3]|uniref:UDP-N-acetylmuramoyl-tripeptide--D-alanyl-D- alanine ligase n=1 Tax=Olivibacter sp. SDN3 TaxID=2764720 RepID=UPI00165194A0|nr:UDP-N-acetylmuramoyl-tripeptide--D-alanyl-D-alanine ligase [Olivibacter sp. SDN3]QNL51164.1 UDP-N-acetylmuramoyl-tripeptide--D-alanyl-D-alanine ligase [Olivibacter sp. SDN3]